MVVTTGSPPSSSVYLLSLPVTLKPLPDLATARSMLCRRPRRSRPRSRWVFAPLEAVKAATSALGDLPSLTVNDSTRGVRDGDREQGTLSPKTFRQRPDSCPIECRLPSCSPYIWLAHRRVLRRLGVQDLAVCSATKIIGTAQSSYLLDATILWGTQRMNYEMCRN